MNRFVWRVAPADRLATLRVLTGAYATVFLLVRWRSYWMIGDLPNRQWEGVGILSWLHQPLPAPLARLLLIAAIPCGIAFVLGRRHRFIGPAFAILFLVVATDRLSFGHVIHTEHLVALQLIVLGFSASADGWRPGGLRRDEENERYGWPIQIMVLILVVTYVLAGWAKVRHGGSDWLTGDVLRNQVAYDNLRKELLGSPHSPLGAWLVRYGWIFPPAAIATTVVELGAVVVLLDSPRIRTVWAISAWIFHVGVAATMAISFPFPLSFIAYAPLFRVERLLDAIRVRPSARYAT